MKVHDPPKEGHDQLAVKRGQVHDYLCMDLDYSTKGEVNIRMIKFLQKVEDKFPKPILETAKSPSGEHLFQVRKDTYPSEAIPRINRGGTIPTRGCSDVFCIQPCTA